jgi:hydroxyacylglutathione hydrolase
MLLKRFYDTKLAQASYLVGCQATGDALLIDPNRDADQYIRAAEEEGLRITHVTETHIHADFLSGTRELAARAGAMMYLSNEGGPDWTYAFGNDEDRVLVSDGDSFMVGNVKVEVLHTPGHTPEHISFMITDTASADLPMGVFTGDFVFVGDVGRPDLLERAAGIAGTMEDGARTLFRSLLRFKSLPDYLQVWPGHGAGSACGKALGAVPSSTLGYERVANWGLAHENEDRFVEAILAGQPEPPAYFADMKRMNREGPAILNGMPHVPEVPVHALPDHMERGAVVVDTRHPGAFAEGHLQGTINIPLDRTFNTWAGWLIPFERDIYLITDGVWEGALGEAVRDLAMIGLDRVVGHVPAAALESWQAEGASRGTIIMMNVEQLYERMGSGEVAVVDVRGASEWQAGHLPGVPNIPVGYLLERRDELPQDRPLVLQCRSGARSAIAASVLQAEGMTNVVNLVGGYAEWVLRGLPVEMPEPDKVVV